MRLELTVLHNSQWVQLEYDEEELLKAFALTYSIADVRKPNQRTGSYTQDFDIPCTGINNTVWKHAYDANIYQPSVNIKIAKDCIVKVDGVTIGKGSLKMTTVTKHGDTPDMYSCRFLSELATWTDELKNIYLSDLDWTDHNYTVGNIEASWSGTGATDEVLYPVVNIGARKKWGKWYAEDMRPGVYYRQIFEKAFEHIGYAIDSDFITSDMFSRLVLPYFGQFKMDRSAYAFRAGTTTRGLFVGATGAALAGFTNDSDATERFFDAAGAYSTSSETYVAQDSVWIGFTARLMLEGFTTVSDQDCPVFVMIYKNGVEVARTGVQQRCTTGTGTVTEHKIQFGYIPASTLDQFQFKIQKGLNVGFTVEIREYSYWEATFDGNIREGELIDMSQVMDDSISLTELVMDLFLIFNLQCVTDNANKIVKIEPYDSFYLGKDAGVDWTEKLDISKEAVHDQMSDSYTQKVILKYATDSKDYLVTEWEKENKRHYQGYEIDLPSSYSKGTTEISCKHIAASFMMNSGYPGLHLAHLWKGPAVNWDLPETSTDFKPRILYYAGLATAFQHWFIWNNYAVTRSTPHAYSSIPNLTTTDTILSFDNALGASSVSVPGLYHNYHRTFFNSIKEGHLLIGWFKITPKDLAELKDDGEQISLWQKPIWVRDSWYYLQTIEDYNPTEPLTKCTLLKIVNDYGATPAPQKPDIFDHVKHPTEVKPGGGIVISGGGADPEVTGGTAEPDFLYPFFSMAVNNGSGNTTGENLGQMNLAVGAHLHRKGQQALGWFPVVSDDTWMVIGNGISHAERSNLFELKTDGTMYVKGKAIDTSVTEETAADITVGVNTDIVKVDTTGPVTLLLPESVNRTKDKLIVIDITGNASIQNFTVARSGTDMINGATSQTVNTNYGSLTLLKITGGYVIV